MRPTKLTLEGFQGYLEAQTIDLTNTTSAAVTGPVGSGKSSILDGITYALYGKLRTPTKDGVIHTAAKSLKVELQFLLDGAHWKVVRTSGLKAAAKAYLYLRNPETDEWETRGDGDGRVEATDQAISDLLRLSWPAFRASVLVEQGKSGTFANAKPAERHEILADILDLGAYADLAVKLNKERLGKVHQHDTLTATIQTHRQDVEDNAHIEAELKEARKVHKEADKSYQKAVTAHEEAQTTYEAAQHRWQEAKATRADYDHRVLAARTEVDNTGYRTQAAEKEVTNAQREIQRLTQAAEQNKQDRNAEHTRLTRHIAQIDDKLSDESARTVQSAEAEKSISEAKESGAEAEQETNRLQTERQTTQAEIAREESEVEASRKRWVEENHRVKQLAETHGQHSGQCYACGRGLDDELMNRMLADLEERKTTLAEAGQNHARQVITLKEREADLTGQIEATNEKIVQAQKALSTAQAEAARLTTLAEQYPRLRDEKKAVQSELDALDTEDSIWTKKRHQIEADLTETQKRHTTAVVLVRTCREATEAATKALTELENQADQFQDLTALEQSGRQAASTVQSAQADKDTAQNELSRTESARAVLADRAESIKATKQKITRFQKEAEDLAEIIAGLDASITACRPGGIPRMIINDTINAINQSLSEQLDHLSDHNLTAALTTTRETKKGTSKAELTLMVTGADGANRPRPYESFSGGQKFLVDLALHLALAKVLRDRRGAVLDMMCIDEGAASLEGDEKDAVLRVVQSVAAQMVDLMLMVTHDPDVVAALPGRVHVQMISATSVAEVS